MNFQSGQQITAGSTDDTELTLNTKLPGGSLPFVCEIEVTAGTIKFANGSDPVADGVGRTSASGKFHMAHSPGSPLHFIAASALDTFIITVMG